MTRTLQKLIHVGCRDLGIDAETRRGLQLVVTGKASLSDMSDAELEQVVKALKDRGFRPEAGKGRRPAAQRGDVRFCHVMWGLLHRAGKVTVAGAPGLNAFVRERFEKAWGHVPIDIDQMHDWELISDVVNALKAMCRRAGIEVDRR
jgi:phage gp16-like protein